MVNVISRERDNVMSRRIDRAARRGGEPERRRRDRHFRWILWKLAVVGVAISAILAGGVAAADPPAPDVPSRPGDIRGGLFADTSRAIETREGHVLRVWKYAENLRSTLPIGRGLNSYEAWSQLAGEATITPKDPRRKPKSPVLAASLTIGVQLGCPAQAQSLQIGGTLSNAVYASVTPGLSATVGATAGGSGGSSGGEGNGSVNGSVTPSISGTFGDTVTTTGTITGTIGAGQTRDFTIATKNLAGGSAYIVIRETRLSFDGCLGGAQVRSFATATIVTAEGTSSQSTYGKVLWIERDNPGKADVPPPVTEASAEATLQAHSRQALQSLSRPVPPWPSPSPVRRNRLLSSLPCSLPSGVLSRNRYLPLSRSRAHESVPCRRDLRGIAGWHFEVAKVAVVFSWIVRCC